MKIKYNPFSAQSVLLAIVAFLFASHTKKKGEIDFVIDKELKHEDGELLNAIEKHKENAKEDTNFREYPVGSIFRHKESILLAWAACDNEWKKKDSALIRKSITCLYGNLLNGSNVDELAHRLKDMNQQAQMENLRIKGENFVNSGLAELLEDNSVQNKVIKIWQRKTVAVEAPSDSAGSKED